MIERGDLVKMASSLSVHWDKYSETERTKLQQAIRGYAAELGATVNLANDDQASDFGNNKTGAGQAKAGSGHKGKTRSQPRQYGGKFGKKGKNNGEQAQPGVQQIDPQQIIGTINNLQVGQSVSLLGNNAKVKRLAQGYQLYKPDGTVNQVVKDLAAATRWAKGQMKGGVAGQ